MKHEQFADDTVRNIGTLEERLRQDEFSRSAAAENNVSANTKSNTVTFGPDIFSVSHLSSVPSTSQSPELTQTGESPQRGAPPQSDVNPSPAKDAASSHSAGKPFMPAPGPVSAMSPSPSTPAFGIAAQDLHIVKCQICGEQFSLRLFQQCPKCAALLAQQQQSLQYTHCGTTCQWLT